ncbi:MAG: DUF4625 domain-containing protein [Bacteroidetes bacterium]|nr:DUF4625 domain-containing protein [Bacteroidota bacterium]
MKNVLLFTFLAVGLLFTACSDDDDDHDHDHGDAKISIEFLEPVNDEVVASPDDVHVHVRVTADAEFHEVEIKLHPEGDVSDLIVDYDEHAHSTSFDFENDYDLSGYPAGTEFHMEVKVAKDHEGTEFEEGDIHFRLP